VSATIHEISPPDYRDCARCLRNIADEIEAGDYGEVGTVAVAVMGDTLEIFGGGADSAGPSIAMVFGAAHLKLIQALADHGL
jgi:hypothetical protein